MNRALTSTTQHSALSTQHSTGTQHSFDAWYAALQRGGPTEFAELMASALGESEYVGQHGFASASEILDLARLAGVKQDSLVLDVCCGPAGPARWLSRRLGCRVLGLDRSLPALRLARWPDRCFSPSLAHSLRRGQPRLAAAEATHLPITPGCCDVVLVLESMLPIRDKAAFLTQAAHTLKPGGRFACTVELADEVQLRALLSRHGFQVRAWEDLTRPHAQRAERLARLLQQRRRSLSRRWGRAAFSALLHSARTWATLLSNGTVRKAAVVAQLADRQADSPTEPRP